MKKVLITKQGIEIIDKIGKDKKEFLNTVKQ